METPNRGFIIGNLPVTLDDAVRLLGGIVVLMMFIYSGSDIEVDRAKQLLSHAFTDAEKTNTNLMKENERRQNEYQLCRENYEILQKKEKSCSENLQKHVAEINLNQNELRSCHDHKEFSNKLRDHDWERYVDCVGRFHEQRQKYETCKEDKNKQEKTNIQLQQTYNDVEIRFLRGNDAYNEAMRRIRHIQDEVEVYEKKRSVETKAELDNLKSKLLRLTRKKCKGFFGQGESAENIIWEQNEIKQYIDSVDNLRGIVSLAELEQIFKDPCNMAEQGVDCFIETCRLKTDKRELENVLMSKKQHQYSTTFK